MLVSKEIQNNFWLENPLFKLINPFKSLYKKDMSKDKSETSLLMWGVMLYTKPTESFGYMEETQRLKFINDDFMGKTKLDPQVRHRELITSFEKVVMTRLERIAKDWGDKLDERFELLKEIKYDLSNAEDLDKMMSRTDKLWQQYVKCLEDLETEKASSKVEGNAVESLTESGLI